MTRPARRPAKRIDHTNTFEDEKPANTVDDEKPDPSQGTVDLVCEGQILGWVRNRDSSEMPAALDIFDNGILISTVVANLYRKDLDDAGIQGGYAHFRYTIPFELYDGKGHVIHLRHRSGGRNLANSPVIFNEDHHKLPPLLKKIEWIDRDIILRKPADPEQIRMAASRTRRVAILSTYHTSKTFFSYHFGLRDMLVSSGFTVVVVHATAKADHNLQEIESEQCFLFTKRNIGYDFGSWATGVLLLGDVLAELDELLIINDSSVLIQDLRPVIEHIRCMKYDIIGLTDSYERRYHLQSYFLWLGEKACRSRELMSFMTNYSFSSDKDVVISEGEMEFTRFFQESGYSIRALAPYPEVAAAWLKTASELIREIRGLPGVSSQDRSGSGETNFKDALCHQVDDIVGSLINGTPLNPSHFFWDILIEEFGIPLIKRELLLGNPSRIPSYFRISKLLQYSSQDYVGGLVEMIQRYGGKLVPFFPRQNSEVIARLDSFSFLNVSG